MASRDERVCRSSCRSAAKKTQSRESSIRQVKQPTKLMSRTVERVGALVGVIKIELHFVHLALPRLRLTLRTPTSETSQIAICFRFEGLQRGVAQAGECIGTNTPWNLRGSAAHQSSVALRQRIQIERQACSSAAEQQKRVLRSEIVAFRFSKILHASNTSQRMSGASRCHRVSAVRNANTASKQ